MALGMKHYERAYPATDIVLIEPDHRDPELYLANTFSYGQRRQLAEHAYQQTRAMLRADSGTLGAKLARARHRPARRRAATTGAAAWSLRPARRGRVAEAMASLHQGLDDLGSRVGTGPAPGALSMARKPPRRTAERILEVALDLFNRFGEPNVSTTLISAELNISPGNLYYHYPAKDELINALFDRYEAFAERTAQRQRRAARCGARLVLHALAVRTDLAVPLSLPRPQRPAVQEPAAGDPFPVGAEEQDPCRQGHARQHEPGGHGCDRFARSRGHRDLHGGGA